MTCGDTLQDRSHIGRATWKNRVTKNEHSRPLNPIRAFLTASNNNEPIDAEIIKNALFDPMIGFMLPESMLQQQGRLHPLDLRGEQPEAQRQVMFWTVGLILHQIFTAASLLQSHV